MKPKVSEQELISREKNESSIEFNLTRWLQQLKKYRKIEMEEKVVDQEEPDLELQIREAAYYLSLENYSYIPSAGKWILSVTMILGRLEIYALIIFLMPKNWK